MSLTVGSKVEAKDFSDFWYSAEIIEVDYDEMEVLLHYDKVYNKLVNNFFIIIIFIYCDEIHD